MAFNLATGNIACCIFGQGLLCYMNCHVNMWLEMKWVLELTEIGHLSITGLLFERLEWMWSAVGHEVMSMENKCQWMSSLTLYLVNDSSSKWDKNWTIQKFIMQHYTTDDVFWALGLKISKCSQLFVQDLGFYIFLNYFNPCLLIISAMSYYSSIPGVTVESQTVYVWILESQGWNYSLMMILAAAAAYWALTSWPLPI